MNDPHPDDDENVVDESRTVGAAVALIPNVLVSPTRAPPPSAVHCSALRMCALYR